MSKIKLALDVVSDLKSLAESIETLVHAMESNEVANEEPVSEKPTTKKTKTKAEAPVVNESEDTTVEKHPSLEELRAVMADKSRDGFRAEVKAILTKYGANNLSSLDPKHYLSALKEVGELK